MAFGQKLKEHRIKSRLTLRQCSAKLHVDASNWSKIEREVTPPPKEEETLNRWAALFQLSEEERQELHDLAAADRRKIPDDIASDEKVLASLPVFFRALRGRELQGEKLKDFIEDVRKAHSDDSSQSSV